MRRRRALVLLGLALLCGWLAAAGVRGREARARTGMGPLATVVVTNRDLRAGRPIAASQLGLRTVPARFLPPDALGSAADAVGARPAVALPKGSYLTAATLAGGADQSAAGPGALRPGERALVITASGSAGALGPPGGRVDVLVTTGTHGGRGRTYLALQDVQLLAARAGSDADHLVATLRLSVRQAVYLTAAQNFAQEVRLLPRPAGDRGSSAGLSTSGSQL
ncbi:MAG: Flp pilus assembly protein CpaB [Thermoleophilaceae bacterium]